MDTSDNLLGRIQAQYKTFSKGQKRLASYILEHYDEAVFLTAAKLGKEAGVSESTTVRFATQLGFEGYPEFHRALEELVRNKLNSIQRMKVTYGNVPQVKKVLICAFKPGKIAMIKSSVIKYDPDAFVIVCDVQDVFGEGFDQCKLNSL